MPSLNIFYDKFFVNSDFNICHFKLLGPLSSMRHLKDEVDVIKTDIECGLQLSEKSVKFEKEDKIICYEIKVLEQKVDWDPGF